MTGKIFCVKCVKRAKSENCEKYKMKGGNMPEQKKKKFHGRVWASVNEETYLAIEKTAIEERRKIPQLVRIVLEDYFLKNRKSDKEKK